MGSVRHRLSEARHDCNVVLIGDARVGKTALVNRFIHNKFSEVSCRKLSRDLVHRGT
jgi:GTPase SAR1 family protein